MRGIFLGGAGVGEVVGVVVGLVVSDEGLVVCVVGVAGSFAPVHAEARTHRNGAGHDRPDDDPMTRHAMDGSCGNLAAPCRRRCSG